MNENHPALVASRASWRCVQAHDKQGWLDLMADDVVYDSPVGRLHGRQAMIDYFANVAEILEFSPFEGPIEYFGDGDRVVMSCEEHIRDLRTGATTKGRWAWVIDMHDGLMTRVVHFLHFDAIEVLIGPLREGYERTTAEMPSSKTATPS